MRSFALIFLISFYLQSFGQEPDFRSPVDHPILLSGTFCELRTDHFHTGIDIKSKNGAAGDRMYSIGDGYISRIVVKKNGYGRALYINHAGGLMSVYGHMHRFSDKIEQLVLETLYQNEKYEIDMSLDPGELLVTKGEHIGLMGNSGYSFGPHIHFEMRDSIGETTYNPLKYIKDIKDGLAPVIKVLKVSNLNSEGVELDKKMHYPTYLGNSKYKVANKILSSSHVGLSLGVDDKQEGTLNNNGVYRVSVYKNDSLVHQFTMDSTLFENERFINLHMDYNELKRNRKYYHKLYLNQPSKLKIYNKVHSSYFITEHISQIFRVKVEDFYGNSSELEFEMQSGEKDIQPKQTIYNYILDTKSVRLELPYWTLRFPTKAVPERYKIYGITIPDTTQNMAQEILHLGSSDLPLLKAFEIINNIPLEKELKPKAYIFHRNTINKNASPLVTEFDKDGNLVAKSFSFGDFGVALDTIAPEIKVISSGGRLRQIKIEDDVFGFSSLKYRITLDNQFLWLMPDTKTSSLYWDENINWPHKTYDLEVWVEDPNGNQNVLKQKINY